MEVTKVSYPSPVHGDLQTVHTFAPWKLGGSHLDCLAGSWEGLWTEEEAVKHCLKGRGESYSGVSGPGLSPKENHRRTGFFYGGALPEPKSLSSSRQAKD